MCGSERPKKQQHFSPEASLWQLEITLHCLKALYIPFDPPGLFLTGGLKSLRKGHRGIQEKAVPRCRGKGQVSADVRVSSQAILTHQECLGTEKMFFPFSSPPIRHVYPSLKSKSKSKDEMVNK